MIRNAVLFSLTLLLLLSWSGRALTQDSQAIQPDPELWASQNYAKVLDLVLVNGEIELGKFPADIRWIATARIVPSSENSEFKVTLRRAYDGTASGLISMPRGTSIKTQLRKLKRNNPNYTVEVISKHVSVDHWTLTQETCPQLGKIAKEFESQRISPVLSDELMLDAVSYVIWSQSQWGNQMQLRLHGPGPTARKQSHPLLQWVEKLRSVSQACIATSRK